MAPCNLCMLVCISEPWATYSKQLIGHKFCVVCGINLLVGGRVYGSLGHGSPRGGVGGNRRPWGDWTWGGGKVLYKGCGEFLKGVTLQ